MSGWKCKLHTLQVFEDVCHSLTSSSSTSCSWFFLPIIDTRTHGHDQRVHTHKTPFIHSPFPFSLFRTPFAPTLPPIHPNPSHPTIQPWPWRVPPTPPPLSRWSLSPWCSTGVSFCLKLYLSFDNAPPYASLRHPRRCDPSLTRHGTKRPKATRSTGGRTDSYTPSTPRSKRTSSSPTSFCRVCGTRARRGQP